VTAPTFLLHPSEFAAHAVQGDWPVALAVVLVAGLSQAIGQSIVLFVNRVAPVRFAFSLLVGAALFVVGYVFLVLATWLTTLLPGAPHVAPVALAIAMAYAYVPLLFAFLAAMPYLGSPALAALRIWHLAALALAFASLAHVPVTDGLWHVGLGWLVLQVLERTVGQPVADLGRRIADAVAGVSLADEGTAVLKRAWVAIKPAKRDAAAKAKTRRNWTSLAIGLAGLAAFTYLVALLLDPLGHTIFGWNQGLPLVVRSIVGVVWIAIVGLVAACLLAPVETLGWWAGWYGDPVGPSSGGEAGLANAGTLARRGDASGAIDRWAVYLDGVSQSSSTYTPDVETFLDALVPRLPRGTALVRGLMTYSVMNKPLDASRSLGMFWEFLDAVRFKRPQSILGMIVNLRNMLVVSISADARYGPLYNRGIAQIVYASLVEHGYVAGSGTPLTLIGYSGGGQMSAACAPLLAKVLGAPVDIVSLGGVMTGDNDFLAAEHLYHFVGKKDGVEPLGPLMFASRWKIAFLSNWNRALRLGKISLVAAGPVGHQVPGGYMDPHALLPDGRTHLAETIGNISHVLRGQTAYLAPKIPKLVSNYERYRASDVNREGYFPVRPVDDPRFRPTAGWIGRLILPQPADRERVRGALFEVVHAPDGHEELLGSIVPLRWSDDPAVRAWVEAVTRDVDFSANASYSSTYQGFVQPVRVNHWKRVDPLESLAGSHPYDDIVVALDDDAVLEAAPDGPVLRTRRDPVQITGSRYTLLHFVGPAGRADRYRVRFFDGSDGVVRVPHVVANGDDILPASSRDLESSPANVDGWYAYGDVDADGLFVVRALAPRALLRVDPQRTLAQDLVYRYLRKDAWADATAQKGAFATAASGTWNEGDDALLLHTYGGIGGAKAEPSAKGPVYFGHFAYGRARVVREPLGGDLRFEIRYHQVYTHNPDGLIAGAHHWSRFVGDRQYGWLGSRPICDVALKLDAFAPVFPVMLRELDAMTARYRIGDGTGATYVGAANNCAQDANQALFDALTDLGIATPLARRLLRALEPFGHARGDWKARTANLGRTMEDAPWSGLIAGLTSWRTLLPRKASDTVAKIFLQHGAHAYIMRATQIGGHDPTIEPIVPMTF
jgi:hypothetical protein